MLVQRGGRLLFLSVLLAASTAAAGAQKSEPQAVPAQPDLKALQTPSSIAAPGEGTRTAAGPAADSVSVNDQGQTISLEQRELRLEGLTVRSLFRRGPHHVAK